MSEGASFRRLFHVYLRRMGQTYESGANYGFKGDWR